MPPDAGDAIYTHYRNTFFGRGPKSTQPRKFNALTTIKSLIYSQISEVQSFPDQISCFLPANTLTKQPENQHEAFASYFLSDTNFNVLKMLSQKKAESLLGFAVLDGESSLGLEISDYCQSRSRFEIDLPKRLETFTQRLAIPSPQKSASIVLEEKPGRFIGHDFNHPANLNKAKSQQKEALKNATECSPGWGCAAVFFGGDGPVRKEIKFYRQAIDIQKIDGLETMIQDNKNDLISQNVPTTVFLISPFALLSLVTIEAFLAQKPTLEAEFVCPDQMWGYAPKLSLLQFLLCETPASILIDLSQFPVVLLARQQTLR